jgi:hypothetical protein
MTSEKLQQRALEIAELLFSSAELYISRVEFRNHLQEEFVEFGDIIRDALCSNPKITKQQGRIGGIKFAEEKYRRSSLTPAEKTAIGRKVDQLFKDYEAQSKRLKREKPEKELENHFQIWLEKQNTYFTNAAITSFRSDARRGDKWKNVDGYSIQLETFKFHLSFKPILTTFEVKANLPKADGIDQAKHYLNFSHHVYLVFRYDNGAESLKKELEKSGYNIHDGVGIFFTSDGIQFEMLFESTPPKHPSETAVDRHLEILLSENDKEKLLELKYKYLVEEVFIPAIS